MSLLKAFRSASFLKSELNFKIHFVLEREEELMSIKVGDKIPSVILSHMDTGEAKKISTDELLKGKKVVLVGVPGAFTPTCSQGHLPSFVEHADGIKAKGVDIIACISVNEVFVMNAWGENQNVEEKVLMLADGDGEFTKSIGQECDLERIGLGLRSQRYAMIVEDGVVKSLEVDEPAEVAKVSKADKVLEKL